MTQTPRLTLVARDRDFCDFDWLEESSDSLLAFIEGAEFLRIGINATLNEQSLDVKRVIIDRAGDAELFLEILTTLPRHFAGDVLRIDDRGCGFLSATGRGGDRLLYALRPDDVRFYLYANHLVRTAQTELLEWIA